MAVFGAFAVLLLLLAAAESVVVDEFDLTDALGGYTEAPRINPRTQQCPNTPRDIAFLIDGSSSMRPQEFLQMKMFIEDVMKSLPGNTHFSLLQFSNKFEVHFEFRHFHDNRNPSRLLTGVNQLTGSSYTASGIRKAVDLFDPRKGARDTAKKFLIVVTDGEKIGDPLDYPEVVEEANRAGITRFAIGAGPLFLSKTAQQELHAIASHPTLDHVFLVRHFTGLQDIQDQLKQKICAIHGPAIPRATEAPQSPDACSSHSDPQVLRKLEQVVSGLDQVKAKLEVLAARQGKCGCTPHH
ncbi:integrin alpha-M-like [Varanus komodoensis]|uniref:integrin alpha-M-like n=1 Tax=Varanus komodoensis TaxID=61221 RepID=UPI001CF7C3EE|nr:integrin alpha-M-like [Varanus komodoensis]